MTDNYRSSADAGRRSEKLAAKGSYEGVVRRETASEVLQHPATILPLAVCIASGVYLLLLSPMFGGGHGAAIITAGSGIAAAISYYSRYRKLYPRKAREVMDRMNQERVRLDEAALNALREMLQSGFVEIACTEGTETLAEMTRAYTQLQLALSRRRDTDSLSISLIPALAEETYRRGLSVLSDALELIKATHSSGKERLEKEIAQLEMDFHTSEDELSQSERLKIREDKQTARRELLDVLSRLHLNIDQLLHQAQRCGESLHTACIEVTAVRAGGSRTSVDSVIEALQGTIRRVKEVQDELDRLSH
jgi:hypothetical protein